MLQCVVYILKKGSDATVCGVHFKKGERCYSVWCTVRRRQTGDVAACAGLAHSKCNPFLSTEHRPGHHVLQVIASEVCNRWEANANPADQPCV